MSWRSLLFYAAVIVVLYGAGTVVFSSGSLDRTPTGSQSERQCTGQERLEMPRPMTSAEREACGIEPDAPRGSTGVWLFGTEVTKQP